MNNKSSVAACTIKVANTNGLSAPGRWEQVLKRCTGITVLSETHCTAAMQKSLPFSAQDYRILWGSPVSKGSRSGVAFLIKSNQVWDARSIPFLHSPCQKYFEEGRLVACQIFFQKGERSVILYGLYGHAGARWDSDRKKLVEQMLHDVSQDMLMRGSVPVLIAGDYNVQIHESRVLQHYILNQHLFDSCDWGSAPEQSKKHHILRMARALIYSWLISWPPAWCMIIKSCREFFQMTIVKFMSMSLFLLVIRSLMFPNSLTPIS